MPPVAETKPAFQQQAGTNQGVIDKLHQLGLQGPDWLMKQDNTFWTIQLLAARETETLLKFSTDNHLAAESAWYKTTVSGRPLYVLLHRSFANSDIARQSIASLPKPLQQQQPWVKSLPAVKKAIQAGKR